MAHDPKEEFHEAEEVAAPLMVTLAGGLLLLTALVARLLFDHPFHAGVLAMLSAILLGAPLVQAAYRDLVAQKAGMNELAALGVLAAFATAEYATAAAISFFMLISGLLEHRAALGAHKSIESLLRIAPTRAHKVREDGSEVEMDPSELAVGDVVRIRPGDNIPADGRIVSGGSTVDQATITGESLPVEKERGDDVFAGTINLTGALDVQVTRIGEDTTLGRVKELILEAQETRTPVMRMVDRYAEWYTPLILMLAGIVLFFSRDLNRAIAMLVVACPSAIIISVPSAAVASLSAAARLGILVKNVVDLETAKNLTALVFDKTGTVTTGRLFVTRLAPVEGVSEDDLLRTAALAEKSSKHPVARAVTDAARRERLDYEADPEDFEETPGQGVRAVVEGSTILVGRGTWLSQHGVDVSKIDTSDAEGLSILFLTRAGKALGWIGLEDRTRPDATQAMQDLGEAGIGKRVMVTGDRWSVARRVAREMQCTDVLAEVLPHEKVEVVEGLKEEGHTVMVVGDGVNDAPALAAGQISVALGAAGADVAIHSASITLMNNELNRIPFLVHLSQAASRVMHQNLFFSIAFTWCLVAVSAAGFIHPVVGVLFHEATMLVIIFNSARLVRQGEELEDVSQKEDERRPMVKAVPVS